VRSPRVWADVPDREASPTGEPRRVRRIRAARSSQPPPRFARFFQLPSTQVERPPFGPPTASCSVRRSTSSPTTRCGEDAEVEHVVDVRGGSGAAGWGVPGLRGPSALKWRRSWTVTSAVNPTPSVAVLSAVSDAARVGCSSAVVSRQCSAEPACPCSLACAGVTAMTPAVAASPGATAVAPRFQVVLIVIPPEWSIPLTRSMSRQSERRGEHQERNPEIRRKTVAMGLLTEV